MVRCEPMSLLLAPSTRHWLALAGAPLKEISTPARSPLFLGSKFSATATPGIIVVNCTKLRPFKGNSRTCSPVTRLPTTPVCVSTCTAEACTSTVSTMPPTGILIVTLVRSATCASTPLCSTFLKPCFVTVMLYAPGESSGKLKLPSELVVAVRTDPVCVDVMVTLAPATTAPLASVTTPVIVPEVICATAAGTNASKEIIKVANKKYRALRMGNPQRLILLM